MKKVFYEVGTLDKKCYTKYNLSEDILMEHAAYGIYKFIKKQFSKNSIITIISGTGNNGADGITLARLLYKQYKVKLYIPYGVKSDMAVLQLKRVQSLGLEPVEKLPKKSDVIVDCLLGSGLNKPLRSEAISLIDSLNKQNSYKIACDIPSGINTNGNISPIAFKADITFTMGAYKVALFNDIAKEYVGKIKVVDLGIDKKLYQDKTNIFLLNKQDMKLPFRKDKVVHKGSFGHSVIVAGDKQGAAILAAKASEVFGSGLTTIVSKTYISSTPYTIMQSDMLPQNTTAIAIGMGLGKEYDKNILNNNIAKVIDADLFYDEAILKLLEQKNIILTPHPKEFCSLLKLTNLADISIQQLQEDRFKYIDLFAKQYPNVVLLLKGANVLITYQNKIYINPYGKSSLSKGGSGDVLGGLIVSLVAQGYNTLQATIIASLAHTFASRKFKQNDYSLNGEKLIKQIGKL